MVASSNKNKINKDELDEQCTDNEKEEGAEEASKTGSSSTGVRVRTPRKKPLMDINRRSVSRRNTTEMNIINDSEY